MLIPSSSVNSVAPSASLSRRVNANSQQGLATVFQRTKLIKKGEC